MEKLVKVRRKILAFLPKAASVVTFQVSPPISPAGAGKGNPGPIVSLIPKEAPRKSKNGSFDAREPASPKVSCMGQIKYKKKKKKNETVISKPELKPASPPQAFPAQVERKPFVMNKVLKGTKSAPLNYSNKSDHVSDAEANQVAEPESSERVPSLGQMKQFSSARGTLSDFNWRIEAGYVNKNNPLYEEKGMRSEKQARVVVVNVNGAGIDIVEATRKENLWKRRTTTCLNPISVTTP